MTSNIGTPFLSRRPLSLKDTQRNYDSRLSGAPILWFKQASLGFELGWFDPYHIAPDLSVTVDPSARLSVFVSGSFGFIRSWVPGRVRDDLLELQSFTAWSRLYGLRMGIFFWQAEIPIDLHGLTWRDETGEEFSPAWCAIRVWDTGPGMLVRLTSPTDSTGLASPHLMMFNFVLRVWLTVVGVRGRGYRLEQSAIFVFQETSFNLFSFLLVACILRSWTAGPPLIDWSCRARTCEWSSFGVKGSTATGSRPGRANRCETWFVEGYEAQIVDSIDGNLKADPGTPATEGTCGGG